MRDGLCRGVEGELGGPGPGDHTQPRGANPVAEVGVCRARHAVAGPTAAELADLPLQVGGDLLEGERHPRERALVIGLERRLERLADRGPERRIDLADRPPGHVLDLRARHLAATDERRETDRVTCRIVA